MRRNQPSPPQLATRYFQWIAGQGGVEDLLGDLDEIYRLNLKRKGRMVAQSMYWVHVLSLSLSYALKKRKQDAAFSSHYSSGSMSMLGNYLKISYRNLKGQKLFTGLNTLGLSMGMSVALLALAVYVELHQFDQHHPDADRIYRIVTETESNGDLATFASAPIPLTSSFNTKIPGIEEVVPINDSFQANIISDDHELTAYGYVTIPDFLKLFSFPLSEGTPEALAAPNTIIVTHELAEKLFGEAEAYGQTLQTKKWGPLKIGGILAPFPPHTHFSFDLLVGLSTAQRTMHQPLGHQWTNFQGNYCYIKLAEGISPGQIAQNLDRLGVEGDAYFAGIHKKVSYHLQALAEVTPSEDLEDEIGIVFERSGFYLFFGVALLILLPACFNYANMSIARALKRAKEIGIRKVIGSQRQQVAAQFLVETMLVCLLAILLATGIFQLIKMEFKSMLVGSSALTLDLDTPTVLTFLGFALLTGLLTGIIPALYFARISPLQALKSSISQGKVSISGLRKGLLILQFTLTLIFMIGIATLLTQYRHSLTYHMGFRQENILVIPFAAPRQDILRETLKSNPDVRSVCFSTTLPGLPLNDTRYVHFDHQQDSMAYFEVGISEDFIHHMHLTMKWGNILPDERLQVPQVIVNEAFMQQLKTLSQDSTLLQLADGKVKIAGVVKNYNQEPLNVEIAPMLLRYSEACRYALVGIASDDLASTMNSLENSWRSVFPNIPFQSSFLHHEIEKAYDFFLTALKIYGFLAFLAITISCLGLLGMVIYATENRVKEVAIRKTLGASRTALLKALAGTFFKLWFIAIAVGVPIAYVFYDFALIRVYNKYSEGIGWPEIVASVGVTLGLGVITILWQTNKILSINPAINLRNE